MDERKPRAIGYVRVSTEDQVRGVSLDAQRDKIRGYAGLYNLDLVGIEADQGLSAKSLKRPGLQSALAMLDRGEADGLLVAWLDRLSRSLKDWTWLVSEYFDAEAKQLWSVTDSIDTRTSGGRMVLNMLMTVAQWQRENISEKVKDGLGRKIRTNSKCGPKVRYGFAIDESDPRRSKKLDAPVGLIEAADEAEAIASMRLLRSEGASYREIARRLTGARVSDARRPGPVGPLDRPQDPPPGGPGGRPWRAQAPPAKERPTISAQVREVIALRGLGPTELGRLAGVDKGVVSRFIAGTRDIQAGTLDKIATALRLRLVEDAPPRAGERHRHARRGRPRPEAEADLDLGIRFEDRGPADHFRPSMSRASVLVGLFERRDGRPREDQRDPEDLAAAPHGRKPGVVDHAPEHLAHGGLGDRVSQRRGVADQLGVGAGVAEADGPDQLDFRGQMGRLGAGPAPAPGGDGLGHGSPPLAPAPTSCSWRRSQPLSGARIDSGGTCRPESQRQGVHRSTPRMAARAAADRSPCLGWSRRIARQR